MTMLNPPQQFRELGPSVERLVSEHFSAQGRPDPRGGLWCFWCPNKTWTMYLRGLSDLAPTSAPSKKSPFGIFQMGWNPTQPQDKVLGSWFFFLSPFPFPTHNFFFYLWDLFILLSLVFLLSLFFSFCFLFCVALFEIFANSLFFSLFFSFFFFCLYLRFLWSLCSSFSFLFFFLFFFSVYVLSCVCAGLRKKTRAPRKRRRETKRESN